MTPAAAASAPSLLEQVRGLIERTYDHPAGLGPLAPFVVGDEGYRRLIAGRDMLRRVPQAEQPGAQVLLRPTAGGALRANLYLPDRLVRHLELHPPGRGLDDANVDAFAALVEEVDHLLLVAARAPAGPALSLLELELHANVSKELVLRHWAGRLSGRSRLPQAAVEWIRFHLFGKHRFKDPDRSVRRRYDDARRLALRYLERLERLPSSLRLQNLRRFSRMSHHQKLRWLDSAG